jgi:hypothetical protein
MKKESIQEVNSIFQQPWWLNAVAPGEWSVVVAEHGGRVVGRLPYVKKSRRGLDFLRMPALTQTLGPWIEKKEAKYPKILAWQKDVMAELIGKLPKFDSFQQNFHYEITNWLPFYWHGFRQTTRYTYVLSDISDADKVWAGFLENIRREIKKAAKQVCLRTDLGIHRFLEVNEKTFSRQGMGLPYSPDLVHRIDRACGDENRKIFFAEDASGRIHAAIYIIWDERSAYYLMGGGDPELRNSGATSLLMWEAIQFASRVTQKFDFEGSMVEPIERFFRAFGGVQMPYFSISKMTPWLKTLQTVKSGVRLFFRKG